MVSVAYNNQVFRDSGCLDREKIITNQIKFQLQQHDWTPAAGAAGHNIFFKGDRRAILAIVDDIEHVNFDHHEDFLGSLTERDLVITDVFAHRPLRCRILRFPDSWFGIYAHAPVEHSAATHPFFLGINRIDFNRAFLLMRMYFDGALDRGLVNFNCVDHNHQDHEPTEVRRKRWDQYSADVVEWNGDKYRRSAWVLSQRMPLKNYQEDFDTACQKGALHVVVETYCSDYTVSLSEKTFQALCLPRPWTTLSGTWTVARLRQLGFDVMDDIIDHDIYDRLRMHDDKIVHLSGRVGAWCEQFTPSRWLEIEPRCQAAAAHNRDLLNDMASRWTDDQTLFFDQLKTALI